MFPKAQNIETSFKLIRVICIVAILGSLGFAVFVFFRSVGMVDRAESRIYILSAGKAFEAFAGDRKPNLAVEARAHITDFLEDFFTLDPDEKMINTNIRKAFYLCDESAKHVFDNLKEKSYYTDMISGNVSERISIDSISLNMNAYPFYFRCYATQTLTRMTSIVTRSLDSEGFLREVNRSDDNSHGFLIERWTILKNVDMKVEMR